MYYCAKSLYKGWYYVFMMIHAIYDSLGFVECWLNTHNLDWICNNDFNDLYLEIGKLKTYHFSCRSWVYVLYFQRIRICMIWRSFTIYSWFYATVGRICVFGQNQYVDLYVLYLEFYMELTYEILPVVRYVVLKAFPTGFT